MKFNLITLVAAVLGLSFQAQAIELTHIKSGSYKCELQADQVKSFYPDAYSSAEVELSLVNLGNKQLPFLSIHWISKADSSKDAIVEGIGTLVKSAKNSDNKTEVAGFERILLGSYSLDSFQSNQFQITLAGSMTCQLK